MRGMLVVALVALAGCGPMPPPMVDGGVNGDDGERLTLQCTCSAPNVCMAPTSVTSADAVTVALALAFQ